MEAQSSEILAREPRPVLSLAMPAQRTGDLFSGLAPLLVAGVRIYCVDGGNVFNPAKLIVRLRQCGCDPMPFMQRQLFISRAFTCHQLAAATEELIGPLIDHDDPTLALILGIDRLFLDEDLPLYERRYFFSRVVEQARDFGRRGLPILITCGSDNGLRPGAPNPWLAHLRARTRLADDLAGAIETMTRPRAPLSERNNHGPNPADLQHDA